MKKWFTIGFVLFYLGLSAGISVSAHYCGDDLTGLRLLIGGAGCDCGDEKGAADCCKDQQHFVKLEDEFLTVQAITLHDPVQPAFFQEHLFRDLFAGSNHSHEGFTFVQNKAEPPDLNIQLRVFRI